MRNLAHDVVGATRAAAIAAAKWVGKGNGKEADRVAVAEMRRVLKELDFDGRSVLCEGDKDESFAFMPNEQFGVGEVPVVDIVADPLECTDSVALGRDNAMAVIVFAPRGSLYRASDSYMMKIAVGPDAASVIDLETSTRNNIRNAAQACGKKIEDFTVAVLERDRHEKLISEIREVGARVKLFSDGDIVMAIATCVPGSGVDMLMGIGGSTEAILAAAALKHYGGELLCQWKPEDKHMERLERDGVSEEELHHIFNVEELVGRNPIFIATGVLKGPLLKGVETAPDKIVTHSIIIFPRDKKVRNIRDEQMIS